MFGVYYGLVVFLWAVKYRHQKEPLANSSTKGDHDARARVNPDVRANLSPQRLPAYEEQQQHSEGHYAYDQQGYGAQYAGDDQYGEDHLAYDNQQPAYGQGQAL